MQKILRDRSKEQEEELKLVTIYMNGSREVINHSMFK